jgi:2-furoyl-CoA dehydrogenase FAD binding subunit
MKAPPFAYLPARSTAEAIRVLVDDPEATIIAGGQSLVPMLVMRLARPAVLVDIGRLGELATLRRDGGIVRVGAAVRQRDLERSAECAAVPLVAAALPCIGHREVRNRGTVVGSLAHADPAAELPAVAVAVDATLVACGPNGEREIRACDFFEGPFETSLNSDEVLTEVRFPAAAAGDRFAFEEVARRHGDFALCGVAAAVHIDGGRVTHATFGLFGVAGRPLTVDVTDEVAGGGAPREIGADIARGLDPPGDVHATASYRRRLASVLMARCLARALGDLT